MPKNVTMSQIARELGLDRTTVSYIINGHGKKRGYASATIERVNAYLKDKGFVPSRQAVNLRKGTRAKAGIFYCGQLYTHLLEAYNDIASLYNTQPDRLEIVNVPADHIVQGIRELLGRGVTKLVWIHTQDPRTELEHPDIFNYLDRFGQVVIYNYRFGPGDTSRDLAGRGYYLVGVDRVQGYRLLAGYLKRTGHSRAALVSPALMEERRRVFEAAGITCREVTEYPPERRRQKEAGAVIARSLRSALRQGVTAAVFHDDDLAACTMAALKQKGIRVPGDLSITGYDDISIAELVSPALTTLALPVDKMISRTGRILASGGTGRRNCYTLDLVVRQSSGPAR